MELNLYLKKLMFLILFIRFLLINQKHYNGTTIFDTIKFKHKMISFNMGNIHTWVISSVRANYLVSIFLRIKTKLLTIFNGLSIWTIKWFRILDRPIAS